MRIAGLLVGCGANLKHGADYLVVAGAAAEVAGQPVADAALVGVRLGVQQGAEAIRKPGVQMPHCKAAFSRKDCCNGCSSPGEAMPRWSGRRGPRFRRPRPGRSRRCGRPASRCRRRSCRRCILPLVPVMPRTSRSTSSKLCEAHTGSWCPRRFLCLNVNNSGHSLSSPGPFYGDIESTARQHADEVNALADGAAHIGNGFGVGHS